MGLVCRRLWQQPSVRRGLSSCLCASVLVAIRSGFNARLWGNCLWRFRAKFCCLIVWVDSPSVRRVFSRVWHPWYWNAVWLQRAVSSCLRRSFSTCLLFQQRCCRGNNRFVFVRPVRTRLWVWRKHRLGFRWRRCVPIACLLLKQCKCLVRRIIQHCSSCRDVWWKQACLWGAYPSIRSRSRSFCGELAIPVWDAGTATSRRRCWLQQPLCWGRGTNITDV